MGVEVEPFPRVVGHVPVRRALARAVAGARMGISWVVAGPKGVGRALLVRELAKLLHCKQPDAPGVPCQQCSPCQRIERRQHPDVRFVTPHPNDKGEPRSEFQIKQVREELEEVVLGAVEGGQRVFAFEPAEGLRVDAQDTMLKVLEEPPGGAILALLTEREEALLATVVSRCRVVRLNPLPPEQVREVLARHEVDRAEVDERVRWCGGSPGRAMAPHAVELAREADRMLEAIASGAAYRDPMGLVGPLQEWVESAKGSTKAPQRERLRELLLALQRGVRDAWCEALQARLPQLSGATDMLRIHLARCSLVRLQAAIEAADRGLHEVDGNVGPALVLEGVIMEVGALLRP